VNDKRIRGKTKIFELPDKTVRQLKKTHPVKESDPNREFKTEFKCVYKNPLGFYAWFNYRRRSYKTGYYDNANDALEAHARFKLEKALKLNPLTNNLPIDRHEVKRSKIPDYTKNRIYAQQDEKCILCNKNLGEFRIMDHIKPISLGGPDNITNYQALCGSCEHWKTCSFDKTIKEYLTVIPDMSIDMIKNLQSELYLKFNSPC